MMQRLTAAEYVNGLQSGDRSILSRAITLVESTLETDRALADEVLTACLPFAGRAFRLGLTGVPGVGKSTFIDAFGSLLTASGARVAVLAVDPSSQHSRGSILGDKTRMERLARDPNAYIRPSPAGGSLGGVAARTREAMLLCEAAGFTHLIVETVGVGQSETAVSSMVDFFLLLMLSGAGDELQGMKKGIMEMADAVVIHKADGDNVLKAKQARAEYAAALHLFPLASSGWTPRVMLASSTEGTGLSEIQAMLTEFESAMKANGWLQSHRKQQWELWLEDSLRLLLEEQLLSSTEMQMRLARYRKEVAEHKMVPAVAARQLVAFVG